jgi:hypothetical protein
VAAKAVFRVAKYRFAQRSARRHWRAGRSARSQRLTA